MTSNIFACMFGKILDGLEAINDTLKTTSLIKLLAVFITVNHIHLKKK